MVDIEFSENKAISDKVMERNKLTLCSFSGACATVSHDKSKQAKVMVAFMCQRTFPWNPIQKIKVLQF